MLDKVYKDNLNTIASKAVAPAADAAPNISFVSRMLRETLPKSTIFASEAVTNHVRMADQIQATNPGTFITKGGSGLGWNGGAALGIKLAVDDGSFTVASSTEKPFVVMITGDGSFMFSVPSSAAWVAAKYKIPTLMIVLNNGGWNAPRQSAFSVDPNGLAQTATNEELAISFGPNHPRYVDIAIAGSDGWYWGKKVRTAGGLEAAIKEGIRVVTEEQRGAILDVLIE
jgi:thiamine pyrophosphate-dependent acetolactate synthase large subunit-like protein